MNIRSALSRIFFWVISGPVLLIYGAVLIYHQMKRR